MYTGRLHLAFPEGAGEAGPVGGRYSTYPLSWARSHSISEGSGLAGREKQLRERMWLLCKTLFCYRIKKKMVAKHTQVRM